MSKIRELTPDVIAKIAAGEVIERPVFAVKELVENSLDAGADEIIVELVASGLRSIRVIDNGMGMEKEDMVVSFKPHTTSKLARIADLNSVQTLGFRGEALSSIAAVSLLTIRSRTKDAQAGYEIDLRRGEIVSQKPYGMPAGTEIIVQQLFGDVPARKKFLKSERREFQLILETMIHFGLRYPQVHFALTHNGKSVLELPKTTDLPTRIQMLLGNDVYAHIVPVAFSEPHFSLQGFIVTPQVTTSSPQKQYVAINDRGISDKSVSAALKQAYGTLLEKGHHPIAILSLRLPPEMVDVNVHPRKEEVRFLQPHLLADFVIRGVQQALSEHGLSFSPLLEASKHSITTSFAGQLLKAKKLPWELPKETMKHDALLQQIDSLYIFVPLDEGFYLLDQHAAHERILYEQFLAAFTDASKNVSSKKLNKTFLWELGLSDSHVVHESLATFAQLGFILEPFGPKSFVLESIPELFIDRDYTLLLTELLETIKQEKRPSLDSLSAKMIAYLACRGAVKAGDNLTQIQMRELVSQLQETPNNMTCPHGRPTHMLYNKSVLAALFKR